MILYEEVVTFSFLKQRPDVPPVGLCGEVKQYYSLLKIHYIVFID